MIAQLLRYTLPNSLYALNFKYFEDSWITPELLSELLPDVSSGTTTSSDPPVRVNTLNEAFPANTVEDDLEGFESKSPDHGYRSLYCMLLKAMGIVHMFAKTTVHNQESHVRGPCLLLEPGTCASCLRTGHITEKCPYLHAALSDVPSEAIIDPGSSEGLEVPDAISRKLRKAEEWYTTQVSARDKDRLGTDLAHAVYNRQQTWNKVKTGKNFDSLKSAFRRHTIARTTCVMGFGTP